MQSEVTEAGDNPSLGSWTSHIQFSGAKKVVPSRIYSMAIHPQTEHLLVGLLEGLDGRWRRATRTDFSGSGRFLTKSTWRRQASWRTGSETFRIWEARGNSVFPRSRLEGWVRRRPITRLFYSKDHNDLYACSYDKCIRRLDMTTTRFESLFKADSRFDEDVFLHHCIPHPSDDHLFLVSLSNGSSFLPFFTQRGAFHRLAHTRDRVFLSGAR